MFQIKTSERVDVFMLKASLLIVAIKLLKSLLKQKSE